jgi:predicted aspartyl protease
MLRSLTIVAASCVLATGAANSAVPLRPAATAHLVVPASVNGAGPFPFILDTGADGTGIYQWFAEKQGFRPGPPDEVEGMTGTVTSPTYLLDSVEVDGRAIRNVAADSYPNRHDVEIEAGAVGNDLMDGSVAIFDFPCKKVEIWPKPADMRHLLTPHAHKIEGGTVLEGTQLTLPVQVGGARGIAVLDTGSSDTRINAQFLRAAGIDPASASFRDAEPIFGVNSTAMPSRKGPIGTVRFAGLEVSGAEARAMDLPVFKTWGLGDGPAMILGLDLMQGHRLVYDHDAKRFWFDISTCKP